MPRFKVVTVATNSRGYYLFNGCQNVNYVPEQKMETIIQNDMMTRFGKFTFVDQTSVHLLFTLVNVTKRLSVHLKMFTHSLKVYFLV